MPTLSLNSTYLIFLGYGSLPWRPSTSFPRTTSCATTHAWETAPAPSNRSPACAGKAVFCTLVFFKLVIEFHFFRDSLIWNRARIWFRARLQQPRIGHVTWTQPSWLLEMLTKVFCLSNLDGISMCLINKGMYIRMLTILGTILLPHGFPIVAQIAVFDVGSCLGKIWMIGTRFRVRGGQISIEISVRFRELTG